MKSWVEKQFKLSENGTNVKTEIFAGIATFVTMAYVLATVPNILGEAGFNKGGILTAMILLIIVTTVAMALYTNRPFALAPGLGSVSIVAGMVANEGIPADIAAGIIFLSGVLFILVSFLGLREAVVRVIPKSLKFAVSAGVGLFIALIGAKGCGLIVANEAKNVLGFGDLKSPQVILAVIGFLIILILKTRNVPGYIILSILITTIIGIPMGITKMPQQIFALPSGIGDIFLQINIWGALKIAYVPFLIALFIPDFFSTFGTVLGVGAKAGYLDEDGNLPGIDKCFQVDAIATALGGLFCIPCLTTYLESSVGVESGGRTGLTTISTSVVFALTLFLAPIALMIPGAATAPALIYIGIGMLSSMKNIDYSDETECFPAFICIVFTIFANNIANGICAALPVYLILKLISGKRKELSPALYVIVAVCVFYFYSIIR
ncbi:putative MFS transporter, AGZA family, xanthine/uracil permease [Hespellia stercorisuis DSM 15480]|uniref:Putative MFS transporter, AGZA family, xanthine/uracil permease n=2 Tax=Hespellia stercorisuis TaxID=180311 RepID=A0A1M6S4P6_9FIRM|nr:NCS2 family permease [Hespellia stercorisuis]SHK39487.1 putative MFS transporter, AGZA family, xanthine/uracil permease [Hespellia stercorisuis DSM 15480]